MYYIWHADVRSWRGQPAYVDMRVFREDWQDVIYGFSCEPFRHLMPERLEFDMYGAGGGLPDHIVSANFSLVSSRLGRLIVDTGARHERIPASVYDKRSGALLSEDYSHYHIMNCLEAVDMERTEGEFGIDRWGNHYIERVRHLVLRREIEERNPPMFRVREVQRLVLVNDDFREACFRDGITGSRFDSIEEYDQGLAPGSRRRS